MSKIPHITLDAFVLNLTTLAPADSMLADTTDTCFIVFGLTDGDGDIGNDSTSQIWLKDSRYPAAGFLPTPFPAIDQTIENPKYGLTGTCVFYPLPSPTPRTDPNHLVNGDTLTYEFYITDRANNSSNHIILHPLIVRPK